MNNVEGVVVKRSYAGKGLFATRPFKRGERVIEYVGREIPETEMYTSRSKYLFELTKKRTIDGRPRSNTAGYANHSCRPNCEVYIYGGRIFIRARKAIRPGEEITYDYGKEYFDEHIKPCGCRCPQCAPSTTARRSPPKAQSPRRRRA